MVIFFHYIFLLLQILYSQIKTQSLNHKVFHFLERLKSFGRWLLLVIRIVSVQMMEYYTAITIIFFKVNLFLKHLTRHKICWYIKKIIIFITFWPHCTTSGMFLPWWENKPALPTVEAWSLSYWTAREVPKAHFWRAARDGGWWLGDPAPKEARGACWAGPRTSSPLAMAMAPRPRKWFQLTLSSMSPVFSARAGPSVSPSETPQQTFLFTLIIPSRTDSDTRCGPGPLLCTRVRASSPTWACPALKAFRFNREAINTHLWDVSYPTTNREAWGQTGG